MIQRILIANRGEIARRIIRTAKRLGIETLALYTSEESTAPWVYEADFSYNLGNGSLQQTWLNAPLLVQIARENYCDAIHPGYGFLSENADFSRLCAENNILFIGPSADVIQRMGDKIEARKLVKSLGLAIPEGVEGSIEEIEKQAETLKYPVIIKAAAGGGGKGMIICQSPAELLQNLPIASRQAENWFGSGRVYVEPYFEQARHIEVQLLADKHGNVVHLFERDCSLQRKYQKIIEEAPSPALSPAQRGYVCAMAVEIARKANYTNAGTIEFLFDGNDFYFLEMNTRIQVEHPVTEAITGIDIVEQQIRIAKNKVLPYSQTDIHMSGHAMEVRIYAESSWEQFKPSVGFLSYYHEPAIIPGVRFDATYNAAIQLSANYDGLIAKVTCHATLREETIAKMEKVLDQFPILGITHNAGFLLTLLKQNELKQGHYHTRWIEQFMQKNRISYTKTPDVDNKMLLAAAITAFCNENKQTIKLPTVEHQRLNISGECFEVRSFWHLGKLHLSNAASEKQYSIKRTNKNNLVLVCDTKTHNVVMEQGKEAFYIWYNANLYHISHQSVLGMVKIDKKAEDTANKQGSFELKSPLFGMVLNILVKENQLVKKGDTLITIESMKCENQIGSPLDGYVERIEVSCGENIKEHKLLLSINNSLPLN